MSIISELNRLLENKKNIKEAIKSKLGLDDISNKLSDWPDLIYNIGESEEGEELEELPQDEYSHIWFLPTSNTTVSSFQINISGETVIDWGDGTTNTLTEIGLQFAQHIYSTLPTINGTNKGENAINYTIVEIKIYSEYDYIIEGQGATPNTSMTGTTIPAFNTVANTMLKFSAAENCTIGPYGFAVCNALQQYRLSSRQTKIYNGTFAYSRINTIIIPENIETIGANICSSAASISNIIIKGNLKEIETNAFNGSSIKTITIPESLITLSSGICYNCKSLETVIWKSPYKFIPSSSFGSCYNLKVLDLSNAKEQMYFGTSTNVTGTSNNIALVPGQTKIIIPKELYNTWKANPKWAYMTKYLYWKDDDGKLHNTEVID